MTKVKFRLRLAPGFDIDVYQAIVEEIITLGYPKIRGDVLAPFDMSNEDYTILKLKYSDLDEVIIVL